MRRFVPRAVLGAALAIGAAACAAGTATSGPASEDAGGRYQVMIPDPTPQGGVSERDAQRVAALLRRQVSGMPTHVALDVERIRAAMQQYGVAALDSTTSRQLAQQLGAQNVLYLVLGQGGSGLSADAQFIDVASGDVIRLDDVSGANANELADSIFSALESSIEGLRQAAACNDQLASQQYERALTLCDSALAVVPTSTSALYGKATALLQLERYEEALAAYDDLLQRENTHQDALLGAGLAASNLGRTEDAREYYNRYLELNPGNAQVRMRAATEIAGAGDYVSAYEVLQPVADQFQTDLEFQRFLFSLATAAGQQASNDGGEDAARPYFEAALQAYERAFSSDSVKPDISQIRQAIAVNMGLGRTDQALEMARQATVQYDTVASIWNQYATALADAGRHQEAIPAFTRVIELDPDYEDVYIRRAMAYLETGQQQEALADLQQAAQRDNTDNVARVLFAEGNEAMQATRYEDAEQLLEMAAQYATGELRAQILFFQGYAIFQQGNQIARANGTGA